MGAAGNGSPMPGCGEVTPLLRRLGLEASSSGGPTVHFSKGFKTFQISHVKPRVTELVCQQYRSWLDIGKDFPR